MRKRIAVKAVIVSAVLVTCLVCLGVHIRQENLARQKTELIEEQKIQDEEAAEAVVVEEPKASIHITEAKQFGIIKPIEVKPKEEVVTDADTHTGENGDTTELYIAGAGATTVDSLNAEDAGTEEEQPENDGDGTETDGGAGDDSGSVEANEPEPEPAEVGNPGQQEVGEEEPVSLPEESTEVEEPVIAEELPVEETDNSEWAYYGNCRITHYCTGSCCCGEWAGGPTASGADPIPYWTCANGDLPFGTMVLINGQEYCVTDRGVGGDEFDVLVGNHDEALTLGRYWTDVYIRYPE